MMSLLRRRLGVAGALGLSALGWTHAASAAPDCSSLPSPVYALGGNSPKPFIAKVATALTNANPPQTIVFQTPGACLGIDAIATAGTTMTGTASYWDTTGKENTCNLSVAGDEVQIGIGNNYRDALPRDHPVPERLRRLPRARSSVRLHRADRRRARPTISAAAGLLPFSDSAPTGQAVALDHPVPLIFGRELHLRGRARRSPRRRSMSRSTKMKNVDGGSSTGVITDVSTSAKIRKRPSASSPTTLPRPPRRRSAPLAYQHPMGRTAAIGRAAPSRSSTSRTCGAGSISFGAIPISMRTRARTESPSIPMRSG